MTGSEMLVSTAQQSRATVTVTAYKEGAWDTKFPWKRGRYLSLTQLQDQPAADHELFFETKFEKCRFGFNWYSN